MVESTQFDEEELMHLALRAVHLDKPQDAILFLKKLIEREPTNANAWYLLGAIHAEIGMYDRAKTDMATALQYEPNQSAASFQLGLLHLTSGEADKAQSAWLSLDVLGEENYYYLFKRGLLSLSNDQFENCINDLTKGIVLNDDNEVLNTNMTRIVDAAKSAFNDSDNGESEGDADTDDPSVNTVSNLLSAYHFNDKQLDH